MTAVLGIDVAKKKFDVALYKNGKYKNKVFVNEQKGFEELSAWLKQHHEGSLHACMEASGAYGDTLLKLHIL